MADPAQERHERQERQERLAAMTQEAATPPDEAGTDLTRSASPKIQPVMAGLTLAAIITAIALATFWTH